MQGGLARAAASTWHGAPKSTRQGLLGLYGKKCWLTGLGWGWAGRRAWDALVICGDSVSTVGDSAWDALVICADDVSTVGDSANRKLIGMKVKATFGTIC